MKEETGLDLNLDQLTKSIRVSNAIYYYVEQKWSEVHPQIHTDDEKNDANAITWIKLDCLEDCIRRGQIVLSQHCHIALKRFLNREFPSKSDLVLVTRRKLTYDEITKTEP